MHIKTLRVSPEQSTLKPFGFRPGLCRIETRPFGIPGLYAVSLSENLAAIEDAKAAVIDPPLQSRRSKPRLRTGHFECRAISAANNRISCL
jgi:hypothetical protein